MPIQGVAPCGEAGSNGVKRRSNLNGQYHVLSGRRIVATRNGPCAREVALDYVRAMGCHRDEIIYYGVDGVSWRGAVYRASLIEPEPDVQTA